jgi:hypothetical protein
MVVGFCTAIYHFDSFMRVSNLSLVHLSLFMTIEMIMICHSYFVNVVNYIDFSNAVPTMHS